MSSTELEYSFWLIINSLEPNYFFIQQKHRQTEDVKQSSDHFEVLNSPNDENHCREYDDSNSSSNSSSQ